MLKFSIIMLWFVVGYSREVPSSSITIPATFIAPSTPSIVSNILTPAPHATLQFRKEAISTCYGVCKSSSAPKKNNHESTSSYRTSQTESRTSLFAKKKKAGSGGAGNTLKNGKIQVKLLRHIPGTGNIGDVILVSPAFFQNKLSKEKSAIMVSDEEVAEEKAKHAADKSSRKSAALDAVEKLKSMNISFTKRSGPDGHLFGGIQAKDILKELRSQFPKGSAMEGKGVKVLKIKDEEGAPVDHDIKWLGNFSVTISLSNDIRTDVSVTVNAE